MEHPSRQNAKKRAQSPMEAAMALTDFSADATDPQGSYTGIPANAWEAPVQDADDL